MKYSNKPESTVNSIISDTDNIWLTSKQIVFIDSQVEDYQSLASGVVSDIDVVILDRNQRWYRADYDGFGSIQSSIDHSHRFPRFSWLYIFR